MESHQKAPTEDVSNTPLLPPESAAHWQSRLLTCVNILPGVLSSLGAAVHATTKQGTLSLLRPCRHTQH